MIRTAGVLFRFWPLVVRVPTQHEIVETRALSLAAEERAPLADCLITSLFDDQEIEEAWAIEVELRIEDIEGGRTKLVPASESIVRAPAAIK